MERALRAGSRRHRRRVYTNSLDLVDKYLQMVKQTLGAEVGDICRFYDMTAKIQFGKMRGLSRIHYHLVVGILSLMLSVSAEAAAAYVVQLLKAPH